MFKELKSTHAKRTEKATVYLKSLYITKLNFYRLL
jgi:hypothetical protein